jgi:hypothetical protein
MAETQRLKDGRLAILTPEGWRVASPQEEAASQSSRLEAMGMGAMSTWASYGQMLGPLMARGQGGGSPLGQMLGQASDQVQQNLAPVAQMQPGAMQGGGILGDPFNVGAAVGASGGLARLTMRERVQQQISQAGAAASERAGAAAAENVPGFSSMGAASSREGLVKRMIRSPKGFYDDLKMAVDEFISPEDLTPDQKLMLPVGDELGFKFLPGQKNGAAGIRRLAGSDPIIEAAFAPEMNANLQGLRKSVAAAIGQPADDFSRNALGQAADDLGAGFEAISGKIGSASLPPELVAKIEAVRKVEPFLVIPESGELGGGELMALRSTLNQASSTAWKAGANAPAGKAEFIDQAIMELDDVIGRQLTPDDLAQWKVLRERWKNLKVLESPNVVNELGDINHRSLAGQLRKYYKGAYSRQTTGTGGRRAGLTPETQAFMDWSRLANQFGDNFPNSGTSTRGRLVQIMTNPKEMAKSLMLRAAIEAQTP